MSVCPSVRKKQIGSHWSDFDKIQYLKIFRISVEINQFLVKSGKNNRTLNTYTYLRQYFAAFFLEQKYFKQML